MRTVHLVGAGVAAIALVLAGCAAGPVGPPVSTATVPEDAPNQGGSGDYALTLRITDEPGGDPIPGAAIIVYWGEFEGEEGGFQVSGSAESGSGGGHADGVVRLDTRPSTPDPETTVPLRTGPNGEATANVPTSQVVGIVASAPGHTEEWIPRAVTGESDSGGTVEFPVYKARITVTENDTMGPGGASPGKVTGTNFDWQPSEVPWGDSNAARKGYVERLASARLTLTWTNGVSGGGDMSIGVGDTTSEPDFVQDQDNPQASPGQHTEEAIIDKGQIDEFGWPASETLYVGPATSSGYVAPMGLEYELKTEARFDPFAQPTSGSGSENEAPGPAIVVVPALALSALALRRRDG